MVSISGVKDRSVELIRKDGYEIVVFGGWPNWENYFKLYVGSLKPEEQWQWGQNYPELIVEDIVKNRPYLDELTDDELRNWLYEEMMYRGVNKWLFVRYMLVRYKKLVAEWRNHSYIGYIRYSDWWDNYKQNVKRRGLAYVPIQGDVMNAYHYAYWKGYHDAMKKVREDLKVMATMPRYVIWNGSKPGVIIDKRIGARHKKLIGELYNVRFRS